MHVRASKAGSCDLRIREVREFVSGSDDAGENIQGTLPLTDFVKDQHEVNPRSGLRSLVACVKQIVERHRAKSAAIGTHGNDLTINHAGVRVYVGVSREGDQSINGRHVTPPRE